MNGWHERAGSATVSPGSSTAPLGARIALMCAEKEPLDCHRTLLVARALDDAGVPVAHILANGDLEPHGKTMDRLLAAFDLNSRTATCCNPGRRSSRMR